METSNIKSIIRKVLKEQESERYMFFSNLQQIKRQCEIMLSMDENEITNILDNGHDWAQDHIAESKNNLDQVFDFLMNETKKDDDFDDEVLTEESKNIPTNKKLWQNCLSWAKSRYKVCPSAYCNGAAAKRYKKLGGGVEKG